MKLSGPAEGKNEGSIFAGGPLLMLAWILGFMLNGLLL
jgi:hypothetical protein